MLPCSHFFRCANVSARVTTLLNPKKSHGAGERSEIKNKSLAFSYMGCFIALVIRARACSGKPWVKKLVIYASKNFGSEKIVRTYVHPFMLADVKCFTY